MRWDRTDGERADRARPTSHRTKPRGGCPKCGGFVVWDIFPGVRAARCAICGLWEQAEQRYSRPQPRPAQPERKPCVVADCRSSISAYNTSGMCPRCLRLLEDWERGKKTKPAPIVGVGGTWHFNPAVRSQDGTPHRLKSTEGRDNVGKKF